VFVLSDKGDKRREFDSFFIQHLILSRFCSDITLWSITCSLRTTSSGQLHLSGISGLHTLRNYPLRTSRVFVR
jgi:hypothetical protein